MQEWSAAVAVAISLGGFLLNILMTARSAMAQRNRIDTVVDEPSIGLKALVARAQARADDAHSKIAAVERDTSEYRERIAREMVTKDDFARLSDRLEEAMDRLGDRIDRAYDRGRSS